MIKACEVLRKCLYYLQVNLGSYDMLKKFFTAFVFSIISFASKAQDVYDGYTLKIPKVSVGHLVYKNVEITVANVLNVNGARISEIDLYISATNQLFIPEVFVGPTAYKNVTITVGTILVVGGSEIPVKKSSYENKSAATKLLGPQDIPKEWRPCGPNPACGANTPMAVAYADFVRDGTYSLILHSMEYNKVNPEDRNRKGHIKFYQKLGNSWIDNTSKILPLEETEGCLHANKAVVADFMQNGMPSVFFACSGFDGPGGIGEKQRMLIGQSDGTYKNIELLLPNICVCTAASAADINGDGYPDLVLTDDWLNMPMLFLINNKDGSFTVDYTRVPQELYQRSNIHTIELIDFEGFGKYDVFVAGMEASSLVGKRRTPSRIYLNNGKGIYSGNNKIMMPTVDGFGYAVDIVYENGSIYLSRTTDLPELHYHGSAIQKINYKTLESTLLYKSYSAFPDGTRWVQSLIRFGDNITSISNSQIFKIGM